jgi:hypothetical protein
LNHQSNHHHHLEGWKSPSQIDQGSNWIRKKWVSMMNLSGNQYRTTAKDVPWEYKLQGC